jgi:hypothetical protein
MKHFNYLVAVTISLSVLLVVVGAIVLAGCAAVPMVAQLISVPTQICVMSVFVGMAVWLAFWAFHNQRWVRNG